jgi:hypothetical protein
MIFLAMLLIELTSNSLNAQIPNNGFENWTIVGNYMEPQGYLTTNPFARTSFYPVTRSTDHYPPSIGNYSIRIESKPSLLPADTSGVGIVIQNNTKFVNGPGPKFPISGHPTSITGYYKYLPQYPDSSMIILLQLYLNGTFVSKAKLRGTAASDWTSFNIPFLDYLTADSGSIMLCSYNSDAAGMGFPKGNSVLFVDNLNFDKLITSVSEEPSVNRLFNFYPNPAGDFITVTLADINPMLQHGVENDNPEINIYNTLCEKVLSESIHPMTSSHRMNIKSLPKGIYFIKVGGEIAKFVKK